MTKKYSVVDWDLVADQSVTAEAVRLYAVLSTYNWPEAPTPSRRELATHLGEDLDTVDRLSRELERAGWLMRGEYVLTDPTVRTV